MVPWMIRKAILTFIITLFPQIATSLEISINSGIENKEPYSVLNITHNEPFRCNQKIDVYGRVVEIICEFEKSPANRFTRSENIFFKISSDVENKKFIVKIVPKKNSYMISIDGSFKDGMVVWEKKAEVAKRWQIIGYDKELPFIKPKKSEGINFPISINSFNTPIIGAIDISKKPLKIEEGRDVPVYLAIKNNIENEMYEQALFEIDDAIKSFPNSIFSKEFLFFKAKALYNLPHLEKEEEIIDIAKAWIKKYPSDEAVPEMLLMLATSYNKLGLADESNYYFERIFTEHVGQKYEKVAKIAFGDIQLQKGNHQKAMDLYNQALSETDDLDVASLAATKIAQRYLDTGDIKNATTFYTKVFNANLNFLLKDKTKAYELAKTLAEKGSYELAYKIALALRDRVDKQEIVYDSIFKDAAYWLELSGDKKGAYRMYKDYLTTFINGGEHEQFVRERLDRLFFDIDEDNLSQKIDKLNSLMSEYPNSDIYQKALLYKVKLYANNKNYSAVLGLKDEILALDEKNSSFSIEAKEVLIDSAKKLAQDALQKDDCKIALALRLEYNLTLDMLFDKKLFSCAKRLSSYELAKEIAKKYINQKDLKERLFWLYEIAKVYFLAKEYALAKEASNDAFNLANSLKEERFYDILYELAFSQKELNEFEALIDSAKKVEMLLPKNSKNIELYKGIVDIALKRKDDLVVTQYAKKALELQKDLKINLYSPKLDLIYAEALIRLNTLELAIEALLGINDKDNEINAKKEYLLGYTYQKLQRFEEAKSSYKKCSEINITSPWINICKEALKLF